jgi:hypothetical protein
MAWWRTKLKNLNSKIFEALKSSEAIVNPQSYDDDGWWGDF